MARGSDVLHLYVSGLWDIFDVLHPSATKYIPKTPNLEMKDITSSCHINSIHIPLGTLLSILNLFKIPPYRDTPMLHRH